MDNLQSKFECAPSSKKYTTENKLQPTPKIHGFDKQNEEVEAEPEEANHLDTQEEEKALILNVHEFQQEPFSHDDEDSTAFLNDVNIFPRSPGKEKNIEVDEYEQAYLEEGARLEAIAFGEIAQEVADKLDNDGPTKMSGVISSEALDYISKLEDARQRKDAEDMSNLVFDADCEGLANEIDLHWYEQKAARLMQESEL